MEAPAQVKQQIVATLEKLPPENLPEVLHFIEYLQFKVTQPKQIVSLHGIWAGLPVDELENDIRQLRRHGLAHLEQEAADGDVSR